MQLTIEQNTPFRRMRRNRQTSALRSLIEETTFSPTDLVAPFFLLEGENKKVALPLPDISALSTDLLLKEAEMLHGLGIPAICLFPIVPLEKKDGQASFALDSKGIIPTAVQLLKKEIPSLCVIADIALDPFTDHGHDGVVDEKGYVLNDETVVILSEMALLYADAGVDMVAPSDMMDGRICAIRHCLDTHHYYNTGILAYSAKYASSLYGPYREALGSQLKFGDKKTYQLNPANVREALLQATVDEKQGADILMVKPALYYLDVIAKLKEKTLLPICAYHVSGEYAMVMAAHEKGILDANRVFLEALMSIKRAGADFIVSYATSRIVSLLQ